MNEPTLYPGLWPQNKNKTAKYSVRHIDRRWEVTVLYDLGEGQEFLVIEGGATDIAERVNRIKHAITGRLGGAFYINEYQHLIVPVSVNRSSHYYWDGSKVDCEFKFEFEGKLLTSKPVDLDGNPLSPGDEWVGPRPGIPYVLAAGGKDIYGKQRAGVNPKVLLSKIVSEDLLTKAIKPILGLRGYDGGRFYVNEHCAIFTPINKCVNYVYCGEIDLAAWFPEPVGS